MPDTKCSVDGCDTALRRLYAEPGANASRIARAMGVSRMVINRRMRELGLPPFRPGRPT